MTSTDLRSDLLRIDGRSYGAYKDLRGCSYPLGPNGLYFDHIQGDPFASPSRLRIQVPADVPQLPPDVCQTPDARRATADYLHRRVLEILQSSKRGRTGSGKSGMLEIAGLGQEVLERTALVVTDEGSLTIRLTAGLPAQGRRILGKAASELLTDRLPKLLDQSFSAASLDLDDLREHVHSVKDQVALRAKLKAEGLVAFLAEKSILPRKSGADDRPMPDAIPLTVPPELERILTLPHAGDLRGLGIPEGVTLIVGGGYHGKSTLLDALARSVYDHISGDGRERCVTRADAVTIRAEDGRSVCGVDLRPFIDNLPMGHRTEQFHTQDASGSTSQAAAIIEALEAGSKVLLIDEDTAATNFMIRDARMRNLVPSRSEPITPFIDRVRQLYLEKGVSTILVVGGAGDYLDVADTVIQMEEYRPIEVTERSRRVAEKFPLGDAAPKSPGPWPSTAPRIPDPRSLDPSRGRKPERVRSVRTRMIEFGTEEIDVSLLDQLVDSAQCRAIGDALLILARGMCDGRTNIPDILDELERRIEDEGLESITAQTFGDRARPRRFEIAAALNRLRSLRLVEMDETVDSPPKVGNNP